LPRDRVPQLREVNARLEETTGFRMLPVAGLIDPRTFLDFLGRGIFLATQYMRHHSRPLYTPEPDVIHELVGHAATLMDPAFCALNRAFGDAVQDADEARTLALIRVYWWTIEFGLVDEGRDRRAYGAGLLSSFGELGAIGEAQHRGFDLDEMAATAFDPTDYQGTLFVAPSWEIMLEKVTAFLR
jgi:phenylalanine-4-hydroxylase